MKKQVEFFIADEMWQTSFFSISNLYFLYFEALAPLSALCFCTVSGLSFNFFGSSFKDAQLVRDSKLSFP